MTDGCTIKPLLRNIVELSKQQSILRPIVFHCLAIERPPDIFCFCQNCTTIGPYIAILND